MVVLALTSGVDAGECPGAPAAFAARNGRCSVLIEFTLVGPTSRVDILRSQPGDLSGDMDAATVIGSVSTSPSDVGVRTFSDTTGVAQAVYNYWARAHGAQGCRESFPSGPASAARYATVPVTVEATCTSLVFRWPPLHDITAIRFTYPSDPLVNIPVPPSADMFEFSGGIPGAIFQVQMNFGTTCGLASWGGGSIMFPNPAQPSANTCAPGVVADSGGAVAVPTGIDVSVAGAYSWTLDGQPVAAGGRFSVGPDGTLNINPVRASDTGELRAAFVSVCPQHLPVTGPSIALAVRRTCPADFNESGLRSVQDIFDFLAAYFAGCQ